MTFRGGGMGPVVAGRHAGARRADAHPAGAAGFGSFLAAAAAALLIALAGVLYVTVEMTLTPTRWLDALDASGAYDRAPAAIAGQIVAWVDSRPKDQPRTLGPLDQSDVEAIVLSLAPPDWLRAEAAAVVPAVVGGVTATGQVHAVVTLDTLKARLTGPTLVGVVLDRIGTWPACTVEQSQQLLGDQPPRCRPATATASQEAVLVTALFSVVAAELPASVDLATAGDAPGAGVLATAGIADVLRVAGAAHSSLPLVLAVAALLLLLCAVLGFVAGGRGWQLGVRRVGAPIVAGGILLLFFSLGVDSLLATVVTGLRQGLVAGGMAPGLVSIVGSAALVMVDRAGWLFMQLGAPLILGGLALLAAAWLLPRKVRPVTGR